MPGPACRFGPFLVDRVSYRVTRDGRTVELTPKLLDLLLYLVDRPAALVTKEDLLDALWPGANVTDNALARAVSELRQALGDSAGDPRYVKTIARRGYRFIAEVEAVTPAHGEIAPRPGPDPSRPPDADARTIFVQDFHNVTGDSDCAWLSAGVAETVTGDLRALGQFTVVDRRRVTEAERRTDGSLEQVAAAVHASLAVVGSFQRSGDCIRITARVLDVAGGEALADAKADGPLAQIFEVQDQIVSGLARDLGLPPRAAPARVAMRDTSRLDAYRAFTNGWVRLESFDVRELPQALADFERAVSLDHRYAVAYAGLANVEIATYEATRFSVEPATQGLERAIAHARHAAALDDDLAEAHGALALALASAWRMPEAVAAAERAVALEPFNWRHLFRLCRASWGAARLDAGARTLALYPEFALSYFRMAMVHIARGRVPEAEILLRQGAAVQDQQIGRGERLPGRGLHWLLGVTRLAQGDVAEALSEFDREISLTDLHHLHGRDVAIRSHLARGMALLADGRPDEATAAFRAALDLYPAHAESRVALALALRAAGAEAPARRELDAAEPSIAALARARPVDAAVVRAALLAAADRTEDAVALLDRSLQDAPPVAAWSLPVEPLLRPLHGHAGFTAVLARLASRAL